MKKINIIAAAIAVVLSASCNRALEFQHETFATFDAVNFSIDETAGKVRIPVSVYNPTGAEINVSVACVDGKAKVNEDFELTYPESGVITFSGAKSTDTLEIAIKPFVGVFTNNKEFTVQISSSTTGVGVGNLRTAKVTIRDLDHPLAAILGEYQGVSASGTYFWDLAFDKNDESTQKVNIIGLCEDNETLVGDVSADMKVITVPFGQMYKAGGYDIMFCGYAAGGYYNPSGNMIFTLTDAGWVQTTDVDTDARKWGIGCLALSNGSPLGWWNNFSPGVVLKKK